MAQASTLQWIAEATALKMKFSELEAQLAVQTEAGKMAQKTFRAARWAWLGRGFASGCVITTGLLGAFMLYFTS